MSRHLEWMVGRERTGTAQAGVHIWQEETHGNWRICIELGWGTVQKLPMLLPFYPISEKVGRGYASPDWEGGCKCIN